LLLKEGGIADPCGNSGPEGKRAQTVNPLDEGVPALSS